MANLVTQTLINIPLTNSFAEVRDNIIHRMAKAFEQGVTTVSEILKQYPEFVPYAFDVATFMENEGSKESADKIRHVAAGLIQGSPSKWSSDHFFSPMPLTGPYQDQVGVKSFYLEDASRNEKDLGHNIDRTRRLEIEVHYPAKKINNPSYKIFPAVYKVRSEIRDDPISEKHINHCVRSQPGIAPLANEKFPIVILSPGHGHNFDDYPQLVEELASYGFCVITVNHPFTNGFSFFTGNLADTKPEMPAMENKKEYDDFFKKEALTHAQDMEFVINLIKNGHIEGFHDFLSDCIDTESIGLIGHSLGGTASLQACRNMPFIKAGINVDGPPDPDDSGKERMSQPFLTIIAGSDNKAETNCRGWEDQKPLYPKHGLESEVTIQEAKHEDFSCNSLFDAIENNQKPLERILGVYRQTNELVVRFFSDHLKK